MHSLSPARCCGGTGGWGVSDDDDSVSPAHTQSLSCPLCGAERSLAICEPIEITTASQHTNGKRICGAESEPLGPDDPFLPSTHSRK
ncbi:hypothetical protein PBY51_018082 [Eleginops maclovinus]|uniref:Uncharacterized protein n=1 Tax=Eleginops maclovinus TaxID=56733 RepID=A0AAN7XG95_ELEMC|nr:hypothetical protein PBY51_018082 [Eleginops maclovinus]